MENFLREVWKCLYSIWTTGYSPVKHMCSLFVFVSLRLEHMCLYAGVVLPLFVCLFVCLSLAHCRCRDEGDSTWDMLQPEEKAEVIHRLENTDLCISTVSISRIRMRKGWPMTAQVRANKSGIALRCKQVHICCYYCVVMFIFIRKEGESIRHHPV